MNLNQAAYFFGYISIELIELGLESKTQIKTLLNIIIHLMLFQN
jgi:hypothetical protein